MSSSTPTIEGVVRPSHLPKNLELERRVSLRGAALIDELKALYSHMETKYKIQQGYVVQIPETWKHGRDVNDFDVEQAIIDCRTRLAEYEDELQAMGNKWWWLEKYIDEVRRSVCDHQNLLFNDGVDHSWYTWECLDCGRIAGDNKYFGSPPYSEVQGW